MPKPPMSSMITNWIQTPNWEKRAFDFKSKQSLAKLGVMTSDVVSEEEENAKPISVSQNNVLLHIEMNCLKMKPPLYSLSHWGT